MTISAAVIALFTFAGGSPSELATTLGQHVKAPVVIMPFEARPVPSFREQEKSDKTLVEQLRVRYGFAVGTSPHGFSSKSYPLAFFDVLREEQYEWTGDRPFRGPSRSYGWKTLAPEVLRTKFLVQGKGITIELPPGHFVTVADLTDRTYSKPVEVNWFYLKARIAVHSKEASATELWKAVASAVGATFVETSEKIVLAQDIKEIKKRMISAYDESVRTAVSFSVTEADNKYAASVLRLMSDDDLSKTLVSREAELILNAKLGSALFEAIRTRVRDNIRATEKELDRGGSWAQDIRKINADTDWSKPATIRVRGGNVMGCEVQHVDPKGKIGF